MSCFSLSYPTKKIRVQTPNDGHKTDMTWKGGIGKKVTFISWSQILVLEMTNCPFLSSSMTDCGRLLDKTGGCSILDALQQIGNKLGKKNWNYSANPCTGESGWSDPPVDKYENAVKCTCITNDTFCHIESIDLSFNKLEGHLPPTLRKPKEAVFIGYMAPEYALRGYLTDKADVYSFGIVALEIVSGKSNTNYKPEEEDCVYLLDWAYVLQERGSLLELVDPKLGSEFNKEEAIGMITIALLCTSTSSMLRPTMSAVVSMLEAMEKGCDGDVSRIAISR
ncbi:hypothetical protein AAC387_Pa12g2097 [Persea americana]